MPAISVIEKVSSISNVLSEVIEFAAKNETIKADFENYISTIGAYNQPESKIRSILVTYIFERILNEKNDTAFSLYLKENKKLDSHQKAVIKALQNSIYSVFEVNNVLKNGFELYNLVNEKEYTVIPLVKMSHLRSIYKGMFLYARIFEFENEFYLLEITEMMSSLKKDEMLKLAVAKIIEEPERVYADNKAKFNEIAKELDKFNQKFVECFDTDEIITTNDSADPLIALFNDYSLGDFTDTEAIRSLIKTPEQYGYHKISEFNSSYQDYLDNSMGGFASHSQKYDVGIIYDKELGLYIVPFWGTLCNIFESDDYKNIEGYEQCVKQFIENDKMPANLLIRLNNKYPAFLDRVNEIYGTSMTFDELLNKYKAHFLNKRIFSPTSVLYSSNAFSELMGYIPSSSENKVDFEGSDKPGRNDTCPCGSGKKYKKCCGMV